MSEAGYPQKRMLSLRQRMVWLWHHIRIRNTRDLKDIIFKLGVGIAIILTIVPFFLVVFEVASIGFQVILDPAQGGLALFTTFPGSGLRGGILNAIIGTTLLVLVAGAVGIPLSVLGAVYLTEYSKAGKLRSAVEFTADVLAGIPSIVFGAFGFAFLVYYLKMGMGLLSGGLTLSFMMIPTILRTTQEALKQVPMSLREASLALGATKWTTTWKITLRAAFPGIITGVLLALGRVMGETAPLIFTTGNNLLAPTELVGPGSWVASMPYTIWAYITDPRSYLQAKAHATALTLLLMVLVVDVAANIISRKVTRRVV